MGKTIARIIATSNLKLKTLLFLLFFLFLAFLFLTFRITNVPPGINGDEASIGYNAILLERTLHDENNRLLPLFILTLDKKDWKQPVTMYTTAIFFKIFGPSYFLLRTISVLFVISSLLLLFFLVNEIFGTKGAWISLFIFLTTPIVIIQSHLALENIALLPFLILWMWMIYKFEKVNKRIYLILSAISLGVSIYSYNGMRLISLMLVLFSLGYILLTSKQSHTKQKIINCVIFLCSIAPFMLLLPLANHYFGGAMLGSYRFGGVKTYQQFINGYLSNFDLSFLFVSGDSTPYHSTGRQGLFLVTLLPFFIVGIYQAINTKIRFLILLILVFFLSPVLYGFIDAFHRGSRLLFLVPSFVIITTFGLLYILKSKILLKWVIVGGILILTIINLGDFLKDYYFEYPKRVVANFKVDSPIGFKKLSQFSKEQNLVPLVQSDLYTKDNPDAQFFELVYFPEKAIVWKLSEVPPKNSVILGANNLTNLDDFGFKEEKIAGTVLSLYYQ